VRLESPRAGDFINLRLSVGLDNAGWVTDRASGLEENIGVLQLSSMVYFERSGGTKSSVRQQQNPASQPASTENGRAISLSLLDRVAL